MLSDIEIAKQAKMLKIGEVAAKLGISEDEYEPYGHYKAKRSESLYAKTKNDPDGMTDICRLQDASEMRI